MPHYTFRYVRGNPREKIFKCAVSEYDRMKKLLEDRGWVRVFDRPASIVVLKGYGELLTESESEARKNDREGWGGGLA